MSKAFAGTIHHCLLCHKLQGLNLTYIPVNEIENQTCLWKILSGMKLTHLGVKLCSFAIYMR